MVEFLILMSAAAVIFLFFFFSSRRRHTRSYGDWSSDVCSSDLRAARRTRDLIAARIPAGPGELCQSAVSRRTLIAGPFHRTHVRRVTSDARGPQIGRASCRERVEILGVGA